MAKFDLSGIPSRKSGMDLSEGSDGIRQSLSTPSSTKLNRRVSNLGSGNNASDHHMRRNSVAWQSMSQHLTLQLQQWRQSQSAARRRHRCRPKSAPSEHKEHIIELIDEQENCKRRQANPIVDEIDCHSGLELEELNIEEKSLLKTDVHIVSLKKLAERFNCDLTSGLTNEIVTEHRNKFGQNKLTPPAKASLLWMFIKQILVGFNGVLWIATLFAFLSYVSSFLKNFLFQRRISFRNHLVNRIPIQLV